MKLRFTIRDLLWLAVVVALVIGWSIDRINSANERTELQKKLEYYTGPYLPIYPGDRR